MFSSRKKTILAVPVLAAAVLLGQGSCVTTPWHTWHTPQGGANATPNATCYELDITVIPPNPPFEYNYTTIENWIALQDKDMTAQWYAPYNVYIGHDVEFSPDLPDHSALLYARYNAAYKIECVSPHTTNGTYVTEDTTRPYDWTYCGPAYP